MQVQQVEKQLILHDLNNVLTFLNYNSDPGTAI
jgi:hypothetical protein